MNDRKRRPTVAEWNDALARNFDEFDEFQRTHTEQQVRDAIATGTAFVGEARLASMRWEFATNVRQKEEQRAKEAAEDRELNRRGVIASETAARAAQHSARWAAVAVFISIAALAISGWPFIKEWWQ
jgi:predicted amidohydrolase YtcJ